MVHRDPGRAVVGAHMAVQVEQPALLGLKRVETVPG